MLLPICLLGLLFSPPQVVQNAPAAPSVRIKLGTLIDHSAPELENVLPKLFKEELQKLPGVEVTTQKPNIVLAVYIDRNKTLQYFKDNFLESQKLAAAQNKKINPAVLEGLQSFINGTEMDAPLEMRVVAIFQPRGAEHPIPHYLNAGFFNPKQLPELVKSVVSFCASNMLEIQGAQ